MCTVHFFIASLKLIVRLQGKTFNWNRQFTVYLFLEGLNGVMAFTADGLQAAFYVGYAEDLRRGFPNRSAYWRTIVIFGAKRRKKQLRWFHRVFTYYMARAVFSTHRKPVFSVFFRTIH